MGWPDRFAEFVARKTERALSATLPPYVTVVEQPDPDMWAIGNSWSTEHFGGPFLLSPSANPARPATSLVIVQSHNGNTEADNPSTLGGGETDLHVVYEGLSRVAADAVLAGARTVRGGHIVFSVWHPELVKLRESLGKPRHPIQVVATRTGLDLEEGLMFNVPDIRVIVLSTSPCIDRLGGALSKRPWISPLAMDQPDDLPQGFERLRAMGIDRISGVGGRTLAMQLLDAGLIQDLYLTISPLDGGTPNTPLYTRTIATRAILRKAGTGVEAGVVFQHSRITSQSAGFRTASARASR